MIKWFADLSYWNSCYTREALKLLQDNGMAAVVLRASQGYSKDGWVDRYVPLLEDLKIPYGMYCFLYPGLDPYKQVDKFTEVLDQYPNTKVKVLDAEYYQDGSGATMSKAKLNSFYNNAINHAIMAEIEPIVYTASWCVDNYFPDITIYNGDWFAFYVKYYSWFQNMLALMGTSIDDKSGKLTTIDNMQAIIAECQKHTPQLPKGITGYGAWQFNTYWPFKELTVGQRHLDANIIKPELLKTWFGIEEEHEEEPKTEQEELMRQRFDPKRATVKPV